MLRFLETVWDENTPLIVMGAGLLMLLWVFVGDLF